MSDQFHEDDGTQPDDRPVTVSRKQLEALERKAKTAAEKESAAAKRAETAERKLAFAEAGVDMSHPGIKYFVAGYDGEVSAEAIKRAAEEAGFLPKAPESAAPPAEEPPKSPQDVADAAGISQLFQATVSPDTSGVNHRAGMEKAAAQAAAAGLDPSVAVANYMMSHGLAVVGDNE